MTLHSVAMSVFGFNLYDEKYKIKMIKGPLEKFLLGMLIFEIVLALFCVARHSLGIAGITYVVIITYIGFKSKRGLILKKRKEGKQSISLRYKFTNIHTP